MCECVLLLGSIRLCLSSPARRKIGMVSPELGTYCSLRWDTSNKLKDSDPCFRPLFHDEFHCECEREHLRLVRRMLLLESGILSTGFTIQKRGTSPIVILLEFSMLPMELHWKSRLNVVRPLLFAKRWLGLY